MTAAIEQVDNDLQAAPQDEKQQAEEAEEEEGRRRKKRKTGQLSISGAQGRKAGRHKLGNDLSSLPLEEQERLALQLLGD